MRSPALPAWRPVNTEVAAPTANSADTEITIAATIAAVPVANKNGRSGSERAHREGGERRSRRHPRRAEGRRVEAELLTRQGVERDVTLAHDVVDERPGLGVGDALGLVDGGELGALLVGERRQLAALDAQLVLVELALRLHRDPFTRRHGEGTGDEPRDAREQHDAVVARPRGDAHHQGEVGHEAVVDPEHRGAQRAADVGAVPALRAGDAAAFLDPRHLGDLTSGRRLLGDHRRGRLLVVAVAVGLVGLGLQHQRQHRLGAEVAGEEHEQPHPERHPRRLHVDARFLEQALPVVGVPLLRRGEGQEDVAPVGIGVLGEAREQRLARAFVGVHLAQALDAALGVGRRHAATLLTEPPPARGRLALFGGSRPRTLRSSRRPRARARSAGRPARPRCGRRCAGSASTSLGRSLPAPDVDERADDRAHHLPAERAWPGCRSAACRRRGRATTESNTRRTVVEPGRPLAAERREVVLAEERVGRHAQAPAGRAVRAPTTRCGRGTGRAPGGSRSCSGRSARWRSGGRRSRARPSRPSRTTTSGPSSEFTDRGTRSGSMPAPVRRRAGSPPGPSRARRRRCVPRTMRSSASGVVRRTFASTHAELTGDGALLGLRGEAAEVGAVVRDDEPQDVRLVAARGSPRTERELGHTSSMRAMGALSPGRGPELQDAQVATRAVRVARADLGEQLVRDVLVVDASRSPAGGRAGRPSSPW